jgi:hypothetical protein
MAATLFFARFNIYLILEGKPHIVDTLSRLWAGRSEIRFPEGIKDFSVFKTVVIGPGIYSASY